MQQEQPTRADGINTADLAKQGRATVTTFIFGNMALEVKGFAGFSGHEQFARRGKPILPSVHKCFVIRL
jgi:hypothetical protein